MEKLDNIQNIQSIMHESTAVLKDIKEMKNRIENVKKRISEKETSFNVKGSDNSATETQETMNIQLAQTETERVMQLNSVEEKSPAKSEEKALEPEVTVPPVIAEEPKKPIENAEEKKSSLESATVQPVSPKKVNADQSDSSEKTELLEKDKIQSVKQEEKVSSVSPFIEQRVDASGRIVRFIKNPIQQDSSTSNRGNRSKDGRFDRTNPKDRDFNSRGTNPQNGYNANRGGFASSARSNNAQGGYNRTAGTNTSRPAYGQGNVQSRDNNFRSPRQPGAALGKPTFKKDFAAPILPTIQPQQKKEYGNKKKTPEKSDTNKQLNKRALIKKGFVDIDTGEDEERMGSRKIKTKKTPKPQVVVVAPRIEKAVITTENLTVKILSEKIGKPVTEILKQLMLLGIMTNINGTIEFETAQLVASELGVEIEQKLDKTFEEVLEDSFDEKDEDSEALVERPPVVTVMGHVDHGKTSILDYFRNTNVTSGEAGGITQHIGAYTIRNNGKSITFIDTPGHAAFTAMRARGAKITDIVILVVAADDGIMPQTVEAINHAKAANVPIIVAINKMDKPTADPERVKQQLTEYEIVPEEWGGDAIIAPVSAKTGQGMPELLEMIQLVAEVRELKANPNRMARGTIIEAELDKGKGPVATILVQNGTLKVGVWWFRERQRDEFVL